MEGNDFIKRLDGLKQQIQLLIALPGQVWTFTPAYQTFYNDVTDFVFREQLSETNEGKSLLGLLPVKSTESLTLGEANKILVLLDGIRRFFLKRYYLEPFWVNVHPRIRTVTQNRMKSGEYADAVEAAFKEINSRIKAIVLKVRGEEKDGVQLMQCAFSLNNPVLEIEDRSTESGRNTQKGYMEIFSGSITAIRNPKAHENTSISKEEAILKLHFASLLMMKIDQALDFSKTQE